MSQFDFLTTNLAIFFGDDRDATYTTKLAVEKYTIDEGSDKSGDTYRSYGYTPDIKRVFVGRIHNL